MNFKELCERRYSCRAYESRPIEAEKLEYIQECVRLAPSAVNRQPWKFILVSGQPELDILHECYNREWIRNAPAIVVCCQNRQEAWVRPCDGKNHADIDIAIPQQRWGWVPAGYATSMFPCWPAPFPYPRATKQRPWYHWVIRPCPLPRRNANRPRTYGRQDEGRKKTSAPARLGHVPAVSTEHQR